MAEEAKGSGEREEKQSGLRNPYFLVAVFLTGLLFLAGIYLLYAQEKARSMGLEKDLSVMNQSIENLNDRLLLAENEKQTAKTEATNCLSTKSERESQLNSQMSDYVTQIANCTTQKDAYATEKTDCKARLNNTEASLDTCNANLTLATMEVELVKINTSATVRTYELRCELEKTELRHQVKDFNDTIADNWLLRGNNTLLMGNLTNVSAQFAWAICCNMSNRTGTINYTFTNTVLSCSTTNNTLNISC